MYGSEKLMYSLASCNQHVQLIRTVSYFQIYSYLFLSSVFYDSTSLHEITEEKMSCVLIVLFLPMCFFFKLCISMDKTLEHECLNSEFLNVVARNFCFNHF